MIIRKGFLSTFSNIIAMLKKYDIPSFRPRWVSDTSDLLVVVWFLSDKFELSSSVHFPKLAARHKSKVITCCKHWEAWRGWHRLRGRISWWSRVSDSPGDEIYRSRILPEPIFKQLQQTHSSERPSTSRWHCVLHEAAHLQFECKNPTDNMWSRDTCHVIMWHLFRRQTSWTRVLWGSRWTRQPQTDREQGSGQERSGQSRRTNVEKMQWRFAQDWVCDGQTEKQCNRRESFREDSGISYKFISYKSVTCDILT